MRFTVRRGLGGLALVLAAAACSAAPGTAGTPSGPAAAAPIPFIQQYVGEYDAGDDTGDRLVLHVDGTFEATLDGDSTAGTFRGPATPAGARPEVTLATDEGQTLVVTFRSVLANVVPPRAFADVTASDGTVRTLAAPWVADNEEMCDATHGTWHGDHADRATGLRCTCDDACVYMPSRGGCVLPRDGQDPPRLPVSDAARRLAGVFEGDGRARSVILATDGRYRATIDGRVEEGTWWDAETLGVDEGSVGIACTSASDAFAGSLWSDGSFTLRWGPDASQEMHRQSP